MARPPRIEFAGALYHVSARGRPGRALFPSPEDAERFLDFLGQVCRRFDWAVYAYCLLPDRFVLLVETRRATLSEGMRRLCGLTAQAWNRAHGGRGPVFQGRFKAVLVDRERYLAEVCREVLRAPVEAGLAAQARDWRWSSCRATLRGPAPDWLAREAVLALFADRPETAPGRFAEAVERFLSGRDPWSDRRRQIFLGPDDFVTAARARADTVAGAAEAGRRPLDWYAAQYPDRREAIARAHLEGGYSQPRVARHFGVHYSTVSRAAARWSAETGMAA